MRHNLRANESHMAIRSGRPCSHDTVTMRGEFVCEYADSCANLFPAIAPNNGNNCSVLDPNCKPMGPVATYRTFLQCENLSIMETITEEEDGVGPIAYGFINAGALAALRDAINVGKASPAGLVFAATAGLMDLGAIAKANSVCTN